MIKNASASESDGGGRFAERESILRLRLVFMLWPLQQQLMKCCVPPTSPKQTTRSAALIMSHLTARDELIAFKTRHRFNPTFNFRHFKDRLWPLEDYANELEILS